VHGTSSGSSLLVGFGISRVEPLGYDTRELAGKLGDESVKKGYKKGNIMIMKTGTPRY
jgi:hypothetical protein